MSRLHFKLLIYTLVVSLSITTATMLSVTSTPGSQNILHFQYIAIYIALNIAAVICGVYILNRQIIKPLKALNNTAMEFSNGLYSNPIPVHQNDEIGDLSDSFRVLQSNLQTTILRQGHESESLNEILVELQASENRATGVFNSVQDGLLLTDAMGTIEAVNPALCEMAGYLQNELLGNSVETLIPSRYRSKHQQSIVEFVLDKKRPIREYMQLELLHKSGNIIPIELSISQITTNDKHNLVAVVHDVTERIESERELRHERDRAQSYLDTAEVAIISIDINGIITLVNRKCCELLGYSEGELIGTEYFSHCPDDDVVDEMREAYKAHITNNETFPKYFYINLQTKDGQVRIFEWHNNTTKDYEWNTTGIILAGTDMTEFRKSLDDRKALRDRLFHAQKMKAIGQLSSGIAHDFNNLLASMMGYTELLQEMLDDNENKSIQEYLQEIYVSGERARDLVEGILKYSRDNKDKADNLAENIYLPTLVSDLTSMLQNILPDSIKLSVNVRQDVHPVLMDSIALQQIVTNLCTNANEAMPDGGDLIIKAENVDSAKYDCSSCGNSFNGDFLVLSISDTGCGIENGAQARLFEPFYTTKHVAVVGKGAGMGLAVVHGLVHDANGHIVVDSRPEAGTTFRIFLPAATPQQTALRA